VSKIYAIDVRAYRGVLFIPRERLVPGCAKTSRHLGRKFTAPPHQKNRGGDGAVDGPAPEAYEKSQRKHSFAKTRHRITHSNFMSREAIDRAARGSVVYIQPAWLYSIQVRSPPSSATSGPRYFQPLRSLFAAGESPAAARITSKKNRLVRPSTR